MSVTSTTTHRVLVVDDAEELRSLIRLRLERAQDLVVVGEAGDGLEAVERARELQPDVVLLDIAMPEMDGLEALPLIREAVPGVRVIVMSAFNEGTMGEQAVQAGACAYVVKGEPLTALVELIRTPAG